MNILGLDSDAEASPSPQIQSPRRPKRFRTPPSANLGLPTGPPSVGRGLPST